MSEDKVTGLNIILNFKSLHVDWKPLHKYTFLTASHKTYDYIINSGKYTYHSVQKRKKPYITLEIKLSLCTLRRHVGGGEWNISPLILNLGTRWFRIVSLKLRPLKTQGKAPVPIDCDTGCVLRGGLDVFEKGKNVFPALEIEPRFPSRPASSVVTTPTELPMLPIIRIFITYTLQQILSEWALN
jgi:hypothetical protein